MYITSCLLLLRNSVLSHSISGRIVERILRPIHVRIIWESYRKTSMRLLHKLGCIANYFPKLYGGPLRNKCVHICLPPSTWGGLYQIVFGWGFFFFPAWNLRSTFCPIALATLRRAQQLPPNVSQSRMSSLRLSGNRCCCCPPPLY